jgi:formate dehydrogenase major subunit
MATPSTRSSTGGVNGLDEFRKSLEPFTMESAAKTCEVPIETLERVAKEIAAADTMCVLWAMGITQHMSASDGSTAISNLLLITGNCMRRGCGAYPLRGLRRRRRCALLCLISKSFRHSR